MKSLIVLFTLISALSFATDRVTRFKPGQIITLPAFHECLSKIIKYDLDREQYRVDIKCLDKVRTYYVEEVLIK